MSRETNSTSAKPHSAFARVLAFLLLGFIVYGTTVEAAHKHGRITVPKNAGSVATFSESATETNANTTLTGCGDCLICQLHQGFSTTLISDPPSLVPSSVKSRCFNATAVLVHSQTATPRTGRAPPQAIL